MPVFPSVDVPASSAQGQIINAPRMSNSYISDSTGLGYMLNVEVHGGTMRKSLNKYGLSERAATKKLLLSKKNVATRLRFAKLHLNRPQVFFSKVLCKVKTKIEMFARL